MHSFSNKCSSHIRIYPFSLRKNAGSTFYHKLTVKQSGNCTFNIFTNQQQLPYYQMSAYKFFQQKAYYIWQPHIPLPIQNTAGTTFYNRQTGHHTFFIITNQKIKAESYYPDEWLHILLAKSVLYGSHTIKNEKH